VCIELTFETENVIGCPDGFRNWVPDRPSSDQKCSVTELGSCPWYHEITVIREKRMSHTSVRPTSVTY